MRYVALCLAVITISGGCPAWAGPRHPTPPPAPADGDSRTEAGVAADAARAQLADRLIKELGDDRYRVREAAHQKLLTMADETTIAALKEATKHPDPEVAIRAE